jgi:hypothetical protein
MVLNAVKDSGCMNYVKGEGRNPSHIYGYTSRVPAVLLWGNSRNVNILLSIFLAPNLIIGLII